MESIYSNQESGSNAENIPEDGYADDPVVTGIEDRMAAVANVPYELDSGATIQLSHRNASGRGILDVHHDQNAAAMDILGANLRPEQRPGINMLFASLIGYFNDVEEGGETVFPCVCDRQREVGCEKLQDICKFLYENGVLNAHPAGHNTPFRPLSPKLTAKVKKAAATLVKATDRLCNGTSKLGLVVKPKARRALLFFSNSVRGFADPRLWHGSCKVIKGMKKTMQRFMHAPQKQEEIGSHAQAIFRWQ